MQVPKAGFPNTPIYAQSASQLPVDRNGVPDYSPALEVIAVKGRYS